jgi:ketosteroid isomerase-like protein
VTPSTRSDIQAIEAADAERARATLGKDAATLDRVLADDLLYVHSSATAESKALYVERVVTGYYDYRSLTNLRRAFRVYGDVALVDGDVRIEVIVAGTPKDFVSRYLQVWTRRQGAWRMVSWQSTPIPAA